jgi:riboflavin kinase/FMN adenylyltransferase
VERELYGETITVELLQFFREEKKFAGIDALKAQIRTDIARGEAYFNEQSVVLS